MERDLSRPSPFDLYLSSSEAKERFSKSEIVDIDKDEKERFMRIRFRTPVPELPKDKDINTHEVFLNEIGKPVMIRAILRGPYAKYPIVDIKGQTGDLEYSIIRGIQGGPIDDGELYNEGFFMNFELITQNINYRIQYGLRYGYHGVNELEIIFCRDKVGRINHLTNPRIRFVGVGGMVWDEEERTPLSSTALNKEVVHPQTNFSFRLEKEEISPWVYKYRMHTKDPSTGKESVLTLPSWIDIKEWDKKVRTQDRSWRDLWREMPIRLEVSALEK